MEGLARGKGGISGGWRASVWLQGGSWTEGWTWLIIFRDKYFLEIGIGVLLANRLGIFTSRVSSSGGRRRKRDGLVAAGFYFTSIFDSM